MLDEVLRPSAHKLDESESCTDKDTMTRSRVQRLLEDMNGIKRAIRADSSNSRAHAEQLLLTHGHSVGQLPSQKFSFGQ